MLLVTYRRKGAKLDVPLRVGIANAANVVDAEDLGHTGTMKALLAAGSSQLERLFSEARAHLGAPDALALADVDLRPPVPDPDKILCLGLNYRDHARDAGLSIPRAPDVFAKFRNALAGAHDDVVAPPVATAEVDYEVELAVVIGRRARRVSEADALDYVAGYSVFNDLSARDMQMRTSQATAGKAIDTFAPMGPGIALARDVGDPQNLALTTRVNGRTMQTGNTADMIFSVAAIIADLTSFMTLEAGDIIATGTPAGVGFTRKPPVFLRDGDIVEVEIEKIGALQNRIVLTA